MNQLQQLYIRHALCDKIIHTLLEECADEPEQPDALAHYREQQARIDAKITALEKERRQALGLPEPEPIIVGLQPAIFTMQAQSS